MRNILLMILVLLIFSCQNEKQKKSNGIEIYQINENFNDLRNNSAPECRYCLKISIKD